MVVFSRANIAVCWRRCIPSSPWICR